MNIAGKPNFVNFRTWQSIYRNKVAMLSLCILALIASLCFCAPLISKFVTGYGYSDQVLSEEGTAPNHEHWFGTDHLGRDLLTRVLYGGRVSFLVALVASLVSLGIGVSYGAYSGWKGRLVDRVMMRIVEIVYALPYTIFVVILMVFIGRGLMPLFLAIGAVEWLTMARLVRGQVLFIKGQTYVQAAQTLGQSQRMIVHKHIIPNVFSTIIICLTLTIPNVMLLESFISYLGLGVQAPMTSWGSLIRDGADNMETYPWMLLFPSIFFASTLFALNVLGDALRDALDPRTMDN